MSGMSRTKSRFLAAFLSGSLLVSGLLSCSGGGGGGSSSGQRFDVEIENISNAGSLSSGAPVIFSFGLFAIHEGASPFFTPGTQASPGLESFAEDADPTRLIQSLQTDRSIGLLGLAQTPVGQVSASTLGPGQKYKTIVEATGGTSFSLALAFLQGNDLFVANSQGINLEPNGEPLAGDVTSSFVLYDAGTEVNQAPGTGGNQVVRQPAPNTGASESNNVQPVADGFQYPAVGQMLRVTVTPE